MHFELKNIKAVIFDCDGTLVDNEFLHYEAWRYVLHQNGYELTKKFYIQNFLGFGDALVSKMTIDLLGFDYSEKLLYSKNEFYLKGLKEITPITSTIKFLNHLVREKEKYGLKLAVASAAYKEEIIQNLTKFEIENSFDVILSGVDDLEEYQDPEGTNKPKPYIYQKVAKILDVEPCQCIAIEDSRIGVFAAVTAGCIAVAVPNEFTQYLDLSHAHLIIDSFEDLDFDQFLKRIPHLNPLETSFK